MTRVKVRCDLHGLYEVGLEEVSLHLCKDSAALSYYQFSCQACGVLRRPADLLIVSLLVGAGLVPHYWSIPAEALEPHAGPALTLDDLIDLHAEINAPGWCAA